MRLTRSCRAHAFTLVELLIVVATLAILASLLLPVLDKAKARAQRTRCQSNLKQLNFAWIMYYQDSGGRLTESYRSFHPYTLGLGGVEKKTRTGGSAVFRP